MTWLFSEKSEHERTLSHGVVSIISIRLYSPFSYRVFSLTWPAYMQIYWNKRKRLDKKRVQLPEDWFGTPTWPPFHRFGTPIWPPWRHVKTLYRPLSTLFTPQILHNYCLRFLLGRLRTCKIFKGEQVSLRSMWKWWIDISGALSNLVPVHSYK